MYVVHEDESGNYLILDTTVKNMNLLMVNIYGPNFRYTQFLFRINK